MGFGWDHSTGQIGPMWVTDGPNTAQKPGILAIFEEPRHFLRKNRGVKFFGKKMPRHAAAPPRPLTRHAAAIAAAHGRGMPRSCGILVDVPRQAAVGRVALVAIVP